MKEYLTEESLGEFLKSNFKFGTWIHDTCFQGRFRPDYRNVFHKIVIPNSLNKLISKV